MKIPPKKGLAFTAILILAWVALAGLLRADFLFWLEAPTARTNSNDPKSENYRNPLFFPTSSPVASPTLTASPSISPTFSAAASFTQTHSPTASPSITSTFTASPPFSATHSPTISETPTVSPTPSETPTQSPSSTESPTPSPTETSTAVIMDPRLIDDFEDGDTVILFNQGRGGDWYTYIDPGAGMPFPLGTVAPGYGSSLYALQFSVPAMGSWLGFGYGFSLSNTASGTLYKDGSAWTGIQFYAKTVSGTFSLPITLEDNSSAQTTKSFALTGSWQKCEVPFASAYGVPAVNAADLKQMQANLWAPSAAADVVIDEVRFANVGCFSNPGNGVALTRVVYDESVNMCANGLGACIGGVGGGTGVTVANQAAPSAPHSGSTYLTVDMNSANWGWDSCGYYNFDGSGGAGQDLSKVVDITNMDTLEFWVRSPSGVTSFGIWLGDATVPNWHDLSATPAPGTTANYRVAGTMPATWGKVVIPLCDLDFTSGSVDKTQIAQIGFWSDGAATFSRVIDVDDIAFVRYNP